ncbi:hypothetical protein GCM10027347_22900 [Larkinella harenae]
MKLLLLLSLILTVFSGCTKDKQATTPLDPLYKTWRLTETKSLQGNWETVSDEPWIEFRADGTIQYQRPEPVCCAPTRFERQSQVLRITETYGGGNCIYVDCAPPSAYNIVSVNDNELILESVYGTLNPTSYDLLKYKPTGK